jgi:hypothetical protein
VYLGVGNVLFNMGYSLKYILHIDDDFKDHITFGGTHVFLIALLAHYFLVNCIARCWCLLSFHVEKIQIVVE